MPQPQPKFVLFAHNATYDKLHQVATLGLTAAAMGKDVIVVLLYAGSWLIRRDDPRLPEALAYALAFLGGGLAMFTGWLGDELVDRLGVGVDEGAHLNAPSSLTARHAR